MWSPTRTNAQDRYRAGERSPGLPPLWVNLAPNAACPRAATRYEDPCSVGSSRRGDRAYPRRLRRRRCGTRCPDQSRPGRRPQHHREHAARPGPARRPSRQGRARAGYEREAFKHWVDADADGCSTRNEVLLQEAVNAPERSGRCTLAGGTWYSPYDDAYVDGARGQDIDRLVPLAEAWDSGAGTWTAAERQAYANGLDDARALIAVTAKSNRSKADQDPATWQPVPFGNSPPLVRPRICTR